MTPGGGTPPPPRRRAALTALATRAAGPWRRRRRLRFLQHQVRRPGRGRVRARPGTRPRRRRRPDPTPPRSGGPSWAGPDNLIIRTICCVVVFISRDLPAVRTILNRIFRHLKKVRSHSYYGQVVGPQSPRIASHRRRTARASPVAAAARPAHRQSR